MKYNTKSTFIEAFQLDETYDADILQGDYVLTTIQDKKLLPTPEDEDGKQMGFHIPRLVFEALFEPSVQNNMTNRSKRPKDTKKG